MKKEDPTKSNNQRSNSRRRQRWVVMKRRRWKKKLKRRKVDDVTRDSKIKEICRFSSNVIDFYSENFFFFIGLSFVARKTQDWNSFSRLKQQQQKKRKERNLWNSFTFSFGMCFSFSLIAVAAYTIHEWTAKRSRNSREMVKEVH